MSDIYVVRNDSGGTIELKDFGISIPDTVEHELGDFDKAIESAELQALIQSDDLIRIVSGVDIPKANALLHNVLFADSRAGDSSHSFATYQDELTISIPGASDDELRIHFGIELENDTKDKITDVQLIIGVTVLGTDCWNFSDKDKNNPKLFSGFCDHQFTGAEDLKLQSKVGGGTITTRNVRLSVEVR